MAGDDDASRVVLVTTDHRLEGMRHTLIHVHVNNFITVRTECFPFVSSPTNENMYMENIWVVLSCHFHLHPQRELLSQADAL